VKVVSVNLKHFGLHGLIQDNKWLLCRRRKAAHHDVLDAVSGKSLPE
jgi:hypothetical protein